jgi:hypothetical protein
MTHFMLQYARWMAARKATTRHLQLVSKLKQLPQTARVSRALARSQARLDKHVLVEDGVRRAAMAVSKSFAYVHNGTGADDLADLKEADRDEAAIAKAIAPSMCDGWPEAKDDSDIPF